MTQPTRDFFIAQFSSSPFASRCSGFQVNNLKNFSFVSKRLPVSFFFSFATQTSNCGIPKQKSQVHFFSTWCFFYWWGPGVLLLFLSKSWKWKNSCIWKGTTIWSPFFTFPWKMGGRVNLRSTSTPCRAVSQPFRSRFEPSTVAPSKSTLSDAPAAIAGFALNT